MLMLLESKPVFGDTAYKSILTDIINSYFRDYTYHPENFRPIFLINDIIRFWKTLCLNYENKRNQPDQDTSQKSKQKVKNIKLKFSRMMTCYGSIASIIAMGDSSGVDELVELVSMTPYQRLKKVVEGRSHLEAPFSELEREYQWFLELTNVSEDSLLSRFSIKEEKVEAFHRADIFGKNLFEIVHDVAKETGYLRYLLV